MKLSDELPKKASFNQSEDIDDLEENVIEINKSPIQNYFPQIKTKSQLILQHSIQVERTPNSARTPKNTVIPMVSSIFDVIKKGFSLFSDTTTSTQ